MRCIALAQAVIASGGRARLITATGNLLLLERAREEGIDVARIAPASGDEDAEAVRRAIEDDRPSWLVVDGYQFDDVYLDRLSSSGMRVLLIDDLGTLPRFPVAALLNQNAHAGLLRYPAEVPSIMLLGTEYVVLRREFWETAPPHRSAKDEGHHLLVMFGGADSLHMTLHAVDALTASEIPGLEIAVVVGPANRDAAQVEALAALRPGRVRLLYDVRAMRELMAWADLALSAGGTSVWEMAYMGLPAIVVQTSPAETLGLRGLRHVGLFDATAKAGRTDLPELRDTVLRRLADPEWRCGMSRLGQQLVDGRGCERVLHALELGGLSAIAAG
jgi:UDP-2,4-diacetamido-2,4,6-trideoxy-beta-L-altropyranose hydrolase